MFVRYFPKKRGFGDIAKASSVQKETRMPGIKDQKFLEAPTPTLLLRLPFQLLTLSPLSLKLPTQDTTPAETEIFCPPSSFFHEESSFTALSGRYTLFSVFYSGAFTQVKPPPRTSKKFHLYLLSHTDVIHGQHHSGDL